MTAGHSLEGTGAEYSLERLLDVRRRTRAAVDAIAARVEVGMAEEDIGTMARELLSSQGLRRGWHRTLTRVGPNTTKGFAEPSDKAVVLRPDDIFFVDIGPIYDGMEGDAGDTFVVGDDPDHHRAKADVRAIWDDVRRVWFERHLTGRALYDHAVAVTEERGWTLNLALDGHRLSDFPHSAHYDGSLAEVDAVPSANLWVLEIAIAHPRRPFGAFYEDLLLEDQRLG